MTMTPDRFGELLFALTQRYQVISLVQVDAILASGCNSEDVLAITFDDSYGCNAVHAVPILQELRVPATFFVATGFIDTEHPMPHDAERGYADLPNFSSTQLRHMAKAGLSIESHTVTHIDFSGGVARDVMAFELEESRHRLQQITGTTVDRLAIPFGSRLHCTDSLVAAAAASGYRRLYAHFGGRNAVLTGGHVGLVLHRVCEVGGVGFVTGMIEGYAGWRSLFARRRLVTGDDSFHPMITSRQDAA